MADAVLKGQKPEVNDTKDYDNGIKVVPSYLLQPVIVDKDNYQKELIDSGYSPPRSWRPAGPGRSPGADPPGGRPDAYVGTDPAREPAP